MPSSDLKEIKFVNVKNSYIDKGYSQTEAFTVDNLIIDRCDFDYLDLRNLSTKNASINNTKIFRLDGGCENSYGATLNHCSIASIGSDFVGLIQYSLIGDGLSGTQCVYENCHYTGSSFNLYKLDDNPSSLGKCDDGTVYGTLGGQTPYTLFPQYPTPDTSIDPNTGKSKSYVEYDGLNKKLTITVKRLGE